MELLEKRDLKDTEESLGYRVFPDQLAHQERKDHLEIQELMENLEHLAHADLLV